MFKALYLKECFKSQLHKAYSSLYQVQHFRQSLLKRATLSTISSPLLKQHSAPAQALQQF